MILLTGAAGKTGRAVLGALERRGAAVRAWVLRPDQVDTVREEGAAQVLIGDMRDTATMEEALAGVEAVYHIAPNMHPDEFRIGRSLLRTARRHRLAHFVYHSVLHPQTEAMPHHWQKLRVEEQLLASRMPFTILQPATYMQNLLANWPAIVRDGTYNVPYPVTSRLSFVDLADVGAVAAKVLLETAHMGATYELVGTAPLSQNEVAAILGEALGHSVTAVEVSLERWESQAIGSGLSRYAVDTLLAMFHYYAAHGLVGNSHVLTMLLGRAPKSLYEFATRQSVSGAEVSA